MEKLLLLLVVLALAPAPALAQRDSVKVQLGEGETTCPTGWTAVDRTWTKPARIYFVLPESLVAAYRRTGGTPDNIQVTQAFVTAVWPTDVLEEAAYASGRLRSEPATSGTVRTCTLP